MTYVGLFVTSERSTTLVSVDPPRERPTCGKYDKKHVGEFLLGTNSCCGCGKVGHMLKDFPNVKSQAKGNNQAQSSCPRSKSPKKNYFTQG